MKTERLDGARLRALLYRLLATQGALLVSLVFLIAVFGRGDPRTARVLVYVAVLPVVVSVVGLLYFTRVSALSKAGAYTRAGDAALTKKAYRELGLGLAVWAAGLAGILLL